MGRIATRGQVLGDTWSRLRSPEEEALHAQLEPEGGGL